MVLDQNANSWYTLPFTDSFHRLPRRPSRTKVLDAKPISTTGIVTKLGEVATDQSILLMILRFCYGTIVPINNERTSKANKHLRTIQWVSFLLNLYCMKAIPHWRHLHLQKDFRTTLSTTEVGWLSIEPCSIHNFWIHGPIEAQRDVLVDPWFIVPGDMGAMGWWHEDHGWWHSNHGHGHQNNDLQWLQHHRDIPSWTYHKHQRIFLCHTIRQFSSSCPWHRDTQRLVILRVKAGNHSNPLLCTTSTLEDQDAGDLRIGRSDPITVFQAKVSEVAPAQAFKRAM